MSWSGALKDAHSKYQGYRDAAFHITWDEMSKNVPDACDLKIQAVDGHAIGVAMANIHMGFNKPQGGFPWDLIWRQVRSTPRRFDIAVWDGSLLCGLAIGMASRGKTNVTIKWVERFDVLENLLRGQLATIVFNAADHYARLLGARRLRVKDPLPGTERLYEAHGFYVAPPMGRVAYYQREVA